MTIRAEHNSEDGLTVFVGEHRLALNCEENRPYTQPSPVELLVVSLAPAWPLQAGSSCTVQVSTRA